MSPWASPIVIVPKKSEPGEHPRRRMCVDYRMLNSLLPPVNKAHSKVKEIVTLVPLPFFFIEMFGTLSTFISDNAKGTSVGLHGGCFSPRGTSLGRSPF